MPALHDCPVILFTILFFLLFATFVVFISQRLVEQAAIALDPLERRTAFLRTALCIGCLVWSLDAGGQFMYPDMTAREPRLFAAIMALFIMVSGSMLSVPALTGTRHRSVIACASLLLALTMLGGHVLLISSFGSLTGEVHWGAVFISILLAVGLTMVLALRHRSRRLRAFNGAFRPLSVSENLVAGATIVFLHMALAASVPLVPDGNAAAQGEAIFSFVLFGVLVATIQLYSMKIETARRKLMNKAHARLRTLPNEPGFSDEQQLALIAERLHILLQPPHFHLYFQPIVPIDEKGDKVRFEALLRVEDRQLGKINPEMFMLACARVNRQDMVDRMIIRRSLEISGKWSDLAGSCAGISVNVSPETINSADFVSWILAELHRYSLPDDWLKLEITEHSIIATDSGIADIIMQLRENGVGIFLDDFGTGFSSLGVITSLPIEGMKIDRSLTFNLEKCQSCQILLKHLIALGNDLGLKVTVEGAETIDQLETICRHRVDAVQGYIFAKPMPPELVAEWLCQYQEYKFEEPSFSFACVMKKITGTNEWYLNYKMMQDAHP